MTYEYIDEEIKGAEDFKYKTLEKDGVLFNLVALYPDESFLCFPYSNYELVAANMEILGDVHGEYLYAAIICSNVDTSVVSKNKLN
ncbi:hypothetical protein M316_0074 [Nitrincola phage 1M3-16]|uniref:hypothetical protein n=1 Tax=Nitrincola phage 1M3-16 TaxID=1472912 RepID=UPI000444B011|nr:hypothetical protein GJ22_gp078 [Nitrincola phage 1M3-16]AHX01139.1 hypothetical protein M316_0074 [Nitrincola phage 1M3-16]